MQVKLNDAQKRAVNHKDGPMLVVAGAGTGKTSVIVERMLKLVESGVDKSQILALTFTEKAAQEMLDRTSDKLHDSYGVELNLFTFNAFGNLLLQEFAVEIGLSNSQRLVGEEGRVVFMREHLDLLELDYFAPVSSPDGQLSTIADYFSDLKQQLITPEAYSDFANKMSSNDEDEKLEKMRHQELARAYGNYVRLMRARNIIDYDDQIYLAVELIKKRPNIMKKLQDRFRYIMVDEFQDTNPMQSELINLLAGNSTNNHNDKSHSAEAVSAQSRSAQQGVLTYVDASTGATKLKMSSKKSESAALPPSRISGECNLFVVGDDDQGIYGWRGATLANILDFTTRYPDAKQVTLIENYRNTQEILDAAWKLIQENNPNRLEYLNRLDKKLVSKRGPGSKPQVLQFTQRESELAWVAEDIKNRITNGQDPGSIAVLGRSRQIVADMHKMLDIFDVEHVATGLGEDLFNQPIILMMIDALTAIWNPRSNIAMYHVLTSRLFNCDGITISKMAQVAREKNIALIELLAESDDKKITFALKLIEQLHAQLNNSSVRAVAFRTIKESGLMEKLKADAPKESSSARDIQTLNQWFQGLQAFEKITTTPSVNSYLENFNVLRAEGETLRDETLEIASDLPTVMTMHKSKGLEWQTVYVVGCNNGSFPYLGGGKGLKIPDELRKSSEADARLSEERRLMYVCATRARDELIISYSTSSGTGKTVRKPSKFIEELGLTGATPTEATESLQLEQYNTTHTPKVSLPATMRDGDNIILSASQAEDYLDCPLNFYYKHVLGVPEEPTSQTEVGSLYHSIIESINKAKLAGASIPSFSDLHKRLTDEWPEVGYASQAQRTRDITKSTAGFEELYTRLVSEPIPVAVEEKFRVHIPDSHCILKGRIDAVMPVDGGLEMHDYKTSTTVTDADKAKRKTSSSKQLTMYAVAWYLQTGELARQVSLDYVRTGQVGVVKKLPRSLETMQASLRQAADDILAGKFPKGASHDYCIHPD